MKMKLVRLKISDQVIATYQVSLDFLCCGHTICVTNDKSYDSCCQLEYACHFYVLLLQKLSLSSKNPS